MIDCAPLSPDGTNRNRARAEIRVKQTVERALYRRRVPAALRTQVRLSDVRLTSRSLGYKGAERKNGTSFCYYFVSEVSQEL